MLATRSISALAVLTLQLCINLAMPRIIARPRTLRIMIKELPTPFLLYRRKIRSTIMVTSRNKGPVFKLLTLLSDGLKVRISSFLSIRNSKIALVAIPPNQSSMRSESYPSVSPTQTNQQWPSAPPSPAYVDGGPSPFNRSLSPQYANYPQATASNAGASPISDTVPPPRRRISPNSSRDQTGPIRTAGNRPTGVQKCSSCKATSSPEWRKGPSGKKELCNA